MNLLTTIAAIIAFIGIYLAVCCTFYLAAYAVIRLAKLVRKSRNNAESDDAELCGFFIVPEAINSEGTFHE